MCEILNHRRTHAISETPVTHSSAHGNEAKHADEMYDVVFGVFA